MEVFFLRAVCLLVMLIGFGSWGIKKLMREHPKTTRVFFKGAFSLFNWFVR